MPLCKQRESQEKRWEEPGGISCQGTGGGCVGPKNYLSNKPTDKNKWEQESCQLIKKAHRRKYWGWASEVAWQAESQCIVVLPNSMYKMFSVPKVGLSHRSAVPCLPARALLGVLLLLCPHHRPVDAGRLRREQMPGWSCRTALGCTTHLSAFCLCQCNGSCGDVADRITELSLVKHKPLLLPSGPSWPVGAGGARLGLAAAVLRGWLQVLGMCGLPATALCWSKLSQVQSGNLDVILS